MHKGGGGLRDLQGGIQPMTCNRLSEENGSQEKMVVGFASNT